MSLLTGLSLKTIASAGSAAVVVGGGGTVAYLYQDSIVDFVHRNMGREQEASEYEYIVATVSSSESEASDDLYASNRRVFKCAITVGDVTTIDSTCTIYKLNKGETADTIAFQDVWKSSRILKKTTLTKDKQILVKVAKSFKDKLTAQQSSFQLISSSDRTKKIADLKWEFDLNKNQTNSNTSITESSLLVIKLNGALTTANVNAVGNSYKCEIGSGTTAIDCKIYKTSSTSTPYTSDNLKALSVITSSDTSVAQGHYLVVDLLGAKKSFADLDGKTISIKKDTNALVSGILDSLLVGNISETPNSSLLFKVSDEDVRYVTNVTTNQNHIITKFASKYSTDANTIEQSNITCRVVEGNAIFEDDTCGIYKFADDSTDSFDLEKLTEDGNKATISTDLAADKYQIVKLAQTIIDKLNKASETPSKLEIIQKDKRTKTFNNQIALLDNKGILTSGTTEAQKLHSNLFVARIKTKGTGVASATTATNLDSLKCVVGTTELDCKIYKLTTDTTNNLAKSAFSSLTNSFTPNTDLVENKYIVVELTTAQKTASELQNKSIQLKKDTADYGTVEFDQLVFGHTETTGKFALPLAKKEVSFIVTKGTDPSDATIGDNDIPATARCKFAAANGTSKVDNYDYSCKLMKFATPQNDKTVTTLTELGTLKTTTYTAWKIKDNTEGFYHLTFDANKLFNLDLSTFDNTPITIEVAPTSPQTASTIYAVVELKHDITDTTAVKGKTDLLLGKVKETVTDQSVSTSKCKFAEDGEDVACTLYKNTEATNKTYKDKIKFDSAISNTETFTATEFYGIKLTAPLDISELSSKTLIYFEQPGSGAANTGKKVTFDIEHIMGGDWATGKKLYFLNTPATQSAG